ncbi:hypothetical protein [Ruegeria atlantica]|uniref:Uncharacterized protein n=1 Tax=Ruegeria atlantica TaxID=81569 RepID=A0A0P1EM59_9RHOB|nr:hypothetical protein [Ruegeria atlantica]CUH42967.1 hypothetical protein RUM4293_01856 [Ruegeria atlantica]
MLVPGIKCTDDKCDEVAIENAASEMGRMEEAKRRYLEGKG